MLGPAVLADDPLLQQVLSDVTVSPLSACAALCQTTGCCLHGNKVVNDSRRHPDKAWLQFWSVPNVIWPWAGTASDHKLGRAGRRLVGLAVGNTAARLQRYMPVTSSASGEVH
jgi:hypothetical protein